MIFFFYEMLITGNILNWNMRRTKGQISPARHQCREAPRSRIGLVIECMPQCLSLFNSFLFSLNPLLSPTLPFAFPLLLQMFYEERVNAGKKKNLNPSSNFSFFIFLAAKFQPFTWNSTCFTSYSISCCWNPWIRTPSSSLLFKFLCIRNRKSIFVPVERSHIKTRLASSSHISGSPLLPAERLPFFSSFFFGVENSR